MVISRCEGGSVSAITADVHVEALGPASSETLTICAIGDSLCTGWVDTCNALAASDGDLGALQWVGSLSDSPGGLATQAQPGYSAATHLAGDLGDVATWLQGLAAPPDIATIGLGVNAVVFESDRQAAAFAELGRIETMISNLRAELPALRVVVLTTLPGAADEAPYLAHDPPLDQWALEQFLRWQVGAWVDAFGEREGEGVFVAAAGVGVDPEAHYGLLDWVHTLPTGQQAIGLAVWPAIKRAMRWA